jgi:hypothetical protein
MSNGMDREFLDQFASPSSLYRGKPFWAWNGRLEPQELRRQVRLLKRMGLGGFFMHARVGLDTPYLSQEWFECVAACVEEAKKLGMEAWLYDEDRWPSGAAGGLVTKNHAYRMRQLEASRHSGAEQLSWDRSLLAAFTANVRGSSAREVRRLRRGEGPAALRPGQTILAFRVRVHPDNDWYNGQAYLDTLNPKAVAEFIRLTHGEYHRRFGRELGKTIPGIFTDEPNYGHRSGWPADELYLPWTDRLPEVFRRRYGYDLLDHLVELLYDLEGAAVSRARYHYFDCLTHLFVDSFSRQVGEFCERAGLPFTGHVLMEETLSSQTKVVGSAMRFYEYMEVPGMDLLTEHRREYDTAKQVSSVARQFGRRWRLTETYGCTGWDFPFAAHKALGDWQLALGINLRCQHISWYTMLGQAKRDYPAGIFYHSPWWELYPKVEDYFARLHVAMTRGEELRDLLVIHPIESMWLRVRQGWGTDPEVARLDRELVALRDALLGAHLDFDYGEEEILSRHGRVERAGGGAQGAQGPSQAGPAASPREPAAAVLALGRARYRAVLVPPLTTIRSSTLLLLQRFAAAGGSVVFAEPVPGHVDALPSEAARELAARCTCVPAAGPRLSAALEGTRRVSITDKRGRELAPVLYLLREDEEALYLFLCNTSLSPAQMKPDIVDSSFVRERRLGFPEVLVRGLVGCEGHPLELDPESGELYRAEATRKGTGWELRTSLPALGSRLFLAPKARQSRLPPARKALRELRREPLGQGNWTVALSEANVLVLDRPRYRIGEEAWRRPEEILRVDRAARDALGLSHRGGQMKQPWVLGRPAHPKAVPVSLEYAFRVEALPGGELYLAVETPERFRIAVNGSPLSTDTVSGFWVDRSLCRLPLDPARLRLGANTVSLDCDYDETFSGLEIAYLLGPFGVRVSGTSLTLTAPPQTLKLGDWVPQGLPFYAANVTYVRAIRPKLQRGERLFVQVPGYRGVAVRVLVDGQSAGIIAWEPNEVEITDLLGRGAGEAELRIEVIGHRRNSHGPLHHSDRWPSWTGPETFATTGKLWADGYSLVPCGLMVAPRLVIRRPL